jgi:hypothetical protein
MRLPTTATAAPASMPIPIATATLGRRVLPDPVPGVLRVLFGAFAGRVHLVHDHSPVIAYIDGADVFRRPPENVGDPAARLRTLLGSHLGKPTVLAFQLAR